MRRVGKERKEKRIEVKGREKKKKIEEEKEKRRVERTVMAKTDLFNIILITNNVRVGHTFIKNKYIELYGNLYFYHLIESIRKKKKCFLVIN